MIDNYIVFSVAGTTYALPSHEVAHVELVENVTTVPNAPAFIDGVVFSRGAVVPALNLRARFGFPKAPYDTRTRLIIVQREARTIGMVVDSAREFMRIPPDAVHPPNEGLNALSGRYLRGVATLGDRIILVLDVSQVLNVGELPEGADAPTASQETR
jgi:purine-binding chemotaxis protein CheW